MLEVEFDYLRPSRVIHDVVREWFGIYGQLQLLNTQENTDNHLAVIQTDVYGNPLEKGEIDEIRTCGQGERCGILGKVA